MSPELSVVILCYRAGKRIYAFVDKTIELLSASGAPSWEIVLVGNYSLDTDDETPEVVEDIASKRENVKAVALPKKGMMGWDARSGLSAARGKYICLIDGDEQMPVEDVIRVYGKIKEGTADFVKTYRAARHDGIARIAVSCIYNLLFKILFPRTNVKDVNSKPKILTKEAYDKMALTSDDWFLDAEMIINAGRLKLKIEEIPTTFYKCKYRKSFIKSAAALEFLKNLLRARIG